jgi:hypothetical protein
MGMTTESVVKTTYVYAANRANNRLGNRATGQCLTFRLTRMGPDGAESNTKFQFKLIRLKILSKLSFSERTMYPRVATEPWPFVAHLDQLRISSAYMG